MNIHNGKTQQRVEKKRNAQQRTAQPSPETAMRSSAQQRATQHSAAYSMCERALIHAVTLGLVIRLSEN